MTLIHSWRWWLLAWTSCPTDGRWQRWASGQLHRDTGAGWASHHITNTLSKWQARMCVNRAVSIGQRICETLEKLGFWRKNKEPACSDLCRKLEKNQSKGRVCMGQVGMRYNHNIGIPLTSNSVKSIEWKEEKKGRKGEREREEEKDREKEKGRVRVRGRDIEGKRGGREE